MKIKLTSFEMRGRCDQERFASYNVKVRRVRIAKYKCGIGNSGFVEETEE